MLCRSSIDVISGNVDGWITRFPIKTADLIGTLCRYQHEHQQLIFSRPLTFFAMRLRVLFTILALFSSVVSAKLDPNGCEGLLQAEGQWTFIVENGEHAIQDSESNRYITYSEQSTVQDCQNDCHEHPECGAMAAHSVDGTCRMYCRLYRGPVRAEELTYGWEKGHGNVTVFHSYAANLLRK
ncbi:hypothetical protein EV421DRAFT_1441009 [Armillaria borealis]|uniref:Uncharacterized protein n=1 Tax=Armillaria borealis TaxID=47425 RepID=A0AA39IZ99_9AGAR|nr:hypothetical protein EV421DRAFT_1441009 [Armillaria borealis]